MATCAICRLFDFTPSTEVRFCGSCGSPLCQLVFTHGTYYGIPPDSGSRVPVEVEIKNLGRSLLELKIDLPDRAISFEGNRTITLNPIYDPVRLKFNVDSYELENCEEQIGKIQYESSDPRNPRGSIRIGLITPAEVEIKSPSQKINLGKISSTPQNEGFDVILSNRGGNSVKVSISDRDPQEYPIQVKFKHSDYYWLEGYTVNAPISFVAWTMSEKSGILKDILVLIFDEYNQGKQVKSTQVPIVIEADCHQMPVVDISRPDFGQMIPGQAADFSSGQTRLGMLELRHRGGSPLQIIDVIIACPSVKLLPGQLPLNLDAKSNPESQLEFIMSTRGRELNIQEKIPIKIRLESQLRNKPLIAQGKASIVIPQYTKGLIAVDFGTINSCVAFIDDAFDAEVEIIIDERNDHPFVPSMMLFIPDLYPCDDWLIYGAEAEQRTFKYPKGVIHSVKRAIEEKEWPIYGELYSCKRLATLIIEQLLLESSRRHNCRPRKVAMTIPAAFWGPKRKIMLEACQEACRLAWNEGMNVSVIDEPCAAAIYYYSQNKDKISSILKEREKYRILVFDFGGGTLDISIVEFFVEANKLAVCPLISRGNNRMGGIDIDRRLSQSLSKEVSAQCKAIDIKTLNASRSGFELKFSKCRGYDLLKGMRLQWYNEIKNAKESLSNEKSIDFSFEPFYDKEGKIIEFKGARYEFKYQLSQLKLEGMLKECLDDARHLVSSTLRSVKMLPEQIDTLLMTGQSSIIPCFQKEIRSMFPHLEDENHQIPLKESVAKGAAWGAMEEAQNRIKIYRFTTCSYRYGIEGSWKKRPADEFIELIPFNSTIGKNDPKDTQTIFIDRGSQKLVIIQNGTEPNDNRLNFQNPDITRIGFIDVSAICAEEDSANLRLYFSTDTGMLIAELNNMPVEIQSVTENIEDAIYI